MRHQPSPDGLVNGLPDQFVGHAGYRYIGYRPGGGSDRQSGPACDFISVKVLGVKPETPATTRAGAGYGNVNLSGESIRKFIRQPIADDGQRGLAARVLAEAAKGKGLRHVERLLHAPICIPADASGGYGETVLRTLDTLDEFCKLPQG